MSSITPNMGLIQPTAGVDSGAVWESSTNSNAQTIDQHNHAPGAGVPITPSGLNINTALPFFNNPAIGLLAAVFQSQPSLATLKAVYVIGNDLYYNDGAGNIIQITSGGAVNATSSGISSGTASASFSSGVLIVNAASNTPADVQMASALLGNNSAGSKFLTLAPPSAMAANITETLPTIPPTTNFMQMDPSGNMAAAVPVKGTNLQILQTVAGAALWASLQAPNVQAFTSSGTYTTPTGALYIRVRMVGGGGGGGGAYISGVGGAGSSGTATSFVNSGAGFTLTATAGFGGGGATLAQGAHGGEGGAPAAMPTGAAGIIATGIAGQSGIAQLPSCTTPGANGAASTFGGNGSGGNANGAGNPASVNSGSGGGGGGSTTATPNGSGGGAGSYVDVTINSPQTSYVVTIGGGGAGGSSGGSGGSSGGAGGSGIAIIEAYFQ